MSKRSVLLTTVAVVLANPSTLPSLAQTPAVKAPVKSTLNGTYTEPASGDTLEVREEQGGKIYFHLNAYYPSINPSLKDRPGGPNLGETDGTVPLVNNKAVWSTSEFGGKCKITMEFKGGTVVIDQDEPEQGCCGFGMNVNATGTYVKKILVPHKRSVSQKRHK